MFPWRPKKSVNLPDICSSSGRTPPNSKLHELLIFWGYFTWSKRAAWKSYAWGLSRKPRPMKACLLLTPAPMVALLLVKKLSSMCIIPSFFAPLMVHLYVQEDDKEIWCREQKTALCPLTGSVLDPQYKEPVYTNSSIMTHKWSWEIILHKTCHQIIFANCTKILPTASDISRKQPAAVNDSLHRKRLVFSQECLSKQLSCNTASEWESSSGTLNLFGLDELPNQFLATVPFTSFLKGDFMVQVDGVLKDIIHWGMTWDITSPWPTWL